MSGDQKQQLEQKLWDIANTLRGRISLKERSSKIERVTHKILIL